MDEIPDISQSINFADLGKELLAGITADGKVSMDAIRSAVVSGMAQAHGVQLKAGFSFLTWIATEVGNALTAIEEPFMPVIAGFVAPIVANMLGGSVDAGAFADRANTEGRNAAAAALVDTFIGRLKGGADGPIEPSEDGARRVATAGLAAALEGWFLGAVPELLSDLLPFEAGHFTALTELPEDVIRALGIGRLVRRALTPLVNATATTPMQWAANIAYRPTKLGVTTVVREMMRGHRDRADVYESLARDGYRDEDIEALINEQAKFLATDDLAFLVWSGLLGLDEAVQTLQDQGWDAQIASKHFGAQQIKREDAIHRQLADAAITAYVDRRIDEGQLADVLGTTITGERERALLLDVARGKRALTVKFLSASEAYALAKAEIIPVADYRDALSREGYTDDAIYALELRLRHELDTARSVAQHKAQQDADRAAAAAAKAAAAAEKKAAAEKAAAAKQLGPIGELMHAVERGLIPIARLQTALVAHYDGDTVNIYIADAEQRRAAYVARQQKAADAAKRADNRGLATGELQKALVDGVLTVDQVRAMLVDRGVASDDVAVLLATMQQAAADHADALKRRAVAEQRAAAKRLTMSEADALAVAGHWTRAQYEAYLTSLGFSAVDVAALDELLDDKIARASRAATTRAAASGATAGRGVTLEQYRRAVLLGERSLEDFAAWLTAQDFTADAVSILTGELRDALDAADAARARRAAAASTTDGSLVPLADLTRAARLGVVTLAQYQAALVARGYAPEAAQLEVDLLTTEIAAAGGTLSAAGGSVAGTTAGAGSPLQLAQARHVTIDGELAARGLSLSETEQGVKAGLLSLDAFQVWLESNGYGQADAELLRALLAAKLGG